MVDELLSIGDFSARCGLSPKMLRSYAAVGLLVPAAVDSASGYRYYSIGQLNQARVVALLRKAGIAVDEIARFFACGDPEALDRWERDLVSGTMSRQRALDEARAALTSEGVSALHAPVRGQKGAGMDHRMEAGVASRTGGRDRNEDAVLIGDRLFAVADGVGGLARGDVASELALNVLEVSFAEDGSIAGLLEACRSANQAVWTEGGASDIESTMGTTLVALAVTSDVGAVVVNAGDSSLYHLRRGQLSQLTRDHTVVAELLRRGELTPAEAETHPYRYVLTRALGVGPEVEIDYAGAYVERGDRFLLCSDGLTKALSQDDFKALLASGAGPQESADHLVATATKRGEEDNVTALVVHVL